MKPGSRKNFVPIKWCPHRWCPHLHAVYFAGMAAVFAQTTAGKLIMIPALLFIVVTALISSTIGVFGQAPVGLVTHMTEVRVDPLWSRLAVTADLAVVALLAAAESEILLGVRQTTSTGLASLVLFGVGVAFYFYAHWRASQPRPAKRVRVRSTAGASL